MRTAACAADGGSPAGPGLGDVDVLFSSLAPRLERIVGAGVHAPRPLIEDACQIAWIRLWGHRGRVRREHALPWLVTTATREARDLLRRERRCLSLDGALEDAGDGVLLRRAQTPADVCEARTRLELIGSLPTRQQRLVWLHGLGFDYEEIATATGSTRRTVERQLLRGKRKLRALAAEGP